MNKKKKQVRAYSLGGLILLIIMIAVIAAFITSGVLTVKSCDGDKTVSKVYNIDRGGVLDGIDVSTTEKSYYYLDIPLKDKELFINDKGYILSIGGSAGVRSDCYATFIIRFLDAKHAEQNILVIANAVHISVPSALSTAHKIVFKEDFYVNIRDTYYEELKKQETLLSQLSMTLYVNGYAYPVSDNYWTNKIELNISGITVKEEEHLRPGDDGFGDNGGLTSTNKNIFDLLKQWYDSLKWWGKTLVWVGVGVVVLGVLSLIASIFKK